MAKVMIVDDAGVIRTLLKRYLTNGGHEVVCQAVNGIEAVEGYKEYKPDIVTMDMSMPDMGGISAIKKIMKIDSKAKIIMISAMDQKDLVVEAIKAGAIYYILKPVNEAKTIEIVNEALKTK
jgi:two-component system, chemotaxis family, chemotaxis protein CheY